MMILNMEQKSPEWYKARCGMPTASDFDKLITSTGKQSTQRTKYMYQLAGERLGGIVEEGYLSLAMKQGNEKEFEARKLYELAQEPVEEVGFCISDCGRFGCSPDGLVGEEGLVEIKCPIMSTHVGYLLENKIPTDYFQQTQGQLLVTDRKWVDFISYYPGLKPLIVRAHRNDVFIIALRNELKTFTKELDELVKKLS